MAGNRRWLVLLTGLVLSAVAFLAPPARAQAIAYVPGIGFIPSGATMTVVPSVTPDRRYVRLGVNAFFNELNSLQTFSFPGGAVGGGGGFGAGGGAVGGGGGGGVFGGFAGMNGLVGGVGVAAGGAEMGAFGVDTTMGLAAGPLPMDAGFGGMMDPFLGDPLNPNMGFPQNAGAFGDMADPGMGGFDPMFPGVEARRSTRAVKRTTPRDRRAAAAAKSKSKTKSTPRSTSKTRRPTR